MHSQSLRIKQLELIVEKYKTIEKELKYKITSLTNQIEDMGQELNDAEEKAQKAGRVAD